MKWYLKSIEKGNPDTYLNLGIFYSSLGDNAKALQWFRKALEEVKKEKDTEGIKAIQEIIKDIESKN